jgi:hypothetical protein
MSTTDGDTVQLVNSNKASLYLAITIFLIHLVEVVQIAFVCARKLGSNVFVCIRWSSLIGTMLAFVSAIQYVAVYLKVSSNIDPPPPGVELTTVYAPGVAVTLILAFFNLAIGAFLAARAANEMKQLTS